MIAVTHTSVFNGMFMYRLPDLREEIAQCGRHGQTHDACMVHYVELKPK